MSQIGAAVLPAATEQLALVAALGQGGDHGGASRLGMPAILLLMRSEASRAPTPTSDGVRRPRARSASPGDTYDPGGNGSQYCVRLNQTQNYLHFVLVARSSPSTSVSPTMKKRRNLDGWSTAAGRGGHAEPRRCFWVSSASRLRSLAPSMGMISAWGVRRSIGATAQDAFGKTVSHCLNSRFVVTTMERCS